VAPRRRSPSRTAAASTAAAAAAASGRGGGAEGGTRERTLYDYWGIGQKPLAHDRVGSVCPFFEAPAPKAAAGAGGEGGAGAEEASVEAQLVLVLELSLAKRSGESRAEGLDAKNAALARCEDRTVWLLFSPRGMRLAMAKWWMLPILLVLLSSHLSSAALQLGIVRSALGLRGAAFRFTALELRGGGLVEACRSGATADAHRRPPASTLALALSAILPRGSAGGCPPQRSPAAPGIAELGLLAGGRAVRAANRTSAAGASLTVAFDAEQAFDGWWFRTADQPVADDPVRFHVERWEEGEGWVDVGYPPWMFKRDIGRVPLGRGEVKEVDLRPDWRYLAVFGPGLYLISALNMALGAAFCAAKQGRQATLAVSMSGVVLSAVSLACACHDTFAQTDAAKSAAGLYWALCALWAVVGAALVTERYVLEGLLFYAIVYSPLAFVHRVAERSSFPPRGAGAGPDDGVRFVWTRPLTTHCISTGVIFAYSACALLARRLVRRWIFYEMVRGDKAEYDAVWAGLVAGGVNAPGLLALRRIARGVETSLGAATLRQRHRPRIADVAPGGGGWWRLPAWRARWSLPSEQVMASLDQIFSQAACLDVLLREKVRQLALASKGCLPIISAADSGGVVAYRRLDTLVSQQARFSVRWAAPKTPDRALEKLVRCYCNDASLVLDCCRQALVFEELGDLVQCLSSIMNDEEVEVVRIKNRLDPDLDSSFCAGYRQNHTG
jgi:hypothetical protein